VICSYEQPALSSDQFNSAIRIQIVRAEHGNSQFRQILEQTGPNTAGEDRPL